VKQLTLTAVQAKKSSPNLVVFIEREGVDNLSDCLTPEEFFFFRQAYQREVNSFFFPRKSGAVWVRVLKGGKESSIAREDARLAGAEVIKEVWKYKVDSVALRTYGSDHLLLSFAEGMALASFQFLKYVTKAEKKRHSLQSIEIESADPSAVVELDAIIEAVFHARRLLNEPFSYLTAPQLGEEAIALGHQYGFSVEVLGKEKIEALKMGGLLAVNRASQTPPQFIVMEWVPVDPKNDQPVVLVGKGVVYDTGGYSIKSSDGMEYMKSDMGGAAAVLGAFVAASRNKLPVHLVGLIPVTDNLVSASGIVPGDIITMASGATVEVLNTDAEGRLILADALHYAKRYRPSLVIDYATLTGAAVRALGNQAICYMGTASDNVKRAIEQSGFSTYERLVEFPLWREYGEEIKSQHADLKNIGGPTAGAITAGKFLEFFTEGYPWLHLDIAGPVFAKVANGYKTKEGTGAGVRLTYDFLKHYFT
jgi:leucyl aminopeptidase